MANYSKLHQTINDNIKPNGNQQTTGQVLQNVLNAIVNSVAEGYLFAGIATVDGNPGSLDQNAWWLAGPGTYANYGNITVAEGKLAALMWNGEWSSSTVDVGGVIKAGTGIKLDEQGRIAIDLVAGDFISIEGNKISCTLDANPFYFVDALPDSPVPGTENKVYVVPASDSPAVNLYKWNAETSEFDLVGTIDLGIDTSNFIKKGVNDITSPLELDSSVESTYPETEQEVFTLKASDSPGLFLKSLTEDTEEGGVDYMVIKAMMSKGSLARYIGLGIVKKDSSFELLKFDKEGVLSVISSAGKPKSATVEMFGLLVADESHKFLVTGYNITFTYSGIYALLDYALNHNYKIYIASTSLLTCATDIYKRPDGNYEMRYFRGRTLMTALVDHDDNVTVNSFYSYAKRFTGVDYNITSWYNASGTSVDLYNDLRTLISGQNNIEGMLGFLCDSNNTFAITGINLTISGSITTLTVGICEPNSLSQDTLTIDSNGVFSVRRRPNVFSASEVGIDTFYPTSNKSYTGLTSFAAHFIRVAQAGIPVFLRTKKNKFSTSEDALVPMMNVSYSSDSVTAYYLQVESTRIGRYSMYVTASGSVTINTLGS